MKFSTHSSRILQSILELSSSFYLLVKSDENVIVQAHPKLLDILGYAEKELLDQPLSMLIDRALDDGALLLQSKSDTSTAVSFVTKDKKQLSVLLTVHSDAIKAGDEKFHCLFVEIVQPNAAPADFFDLKSMFSRILDTIPARIFWKDRNLVYQGSNKKFAQDAGFHTSEQIVGKTDFDFAWKKEEAEFFRQVDSRVMESGKEELSTT